MAPNKIRKALGAVKDKTSIGLAKVGSNSSTISDLDIAIVKATRHDDHPAEDKYIRELLSLTSYSRAYISSCVASLSRRLGKTRNWTVALKTLVVIQRLLAEGDPAYEQEIFFATRRGTRMLNMCDFRDTSRGCDGWDYSAFVRTYAMYLDEQLDFRMHGRRARRRGRSVEEEEEEEEEEKKKEEEKATATPVREMTTDKLFLRTQHLQQLLERFIACRPTGAAKNNRIVAVALYPLVKESYQLYFDLQEIMSIFIDRFTDLEVPNCTRIYEIFCRLSKQFDELDSFYRWCKTAGISRPAEFPNVEGISSKKLQVMDELIRDKSALSNTQHVETTTHDHNITHEDADYHLNNVMALPAPQSTTEATDRQEAEATNEEIVVADKKEGDDDDEDADFLNLRADVVSGEEHGDRLALALFDAQPSGASPWDAFKEDEVDWEKALVLSASNLAGQTTSLGGGFDMALLDGMYNQPRQTGTQGFLDNGSASSVMLPAPSSHPMLALPAPPGSEISGAPADPFVASMSVPPPSYVQMSEMEKKQHLLVEEQLLWQQYARDGMQGQLGIANLQKGHYPVGGCATNLS